MSKHTFDSASSDTPRTAHVRITPTNSVPTAAQVTAGFESLHALAAPSEPSGWRERLGLEQTPAPRLEWLLHSHDASAETGGEPSLNATATDDDRSDAAVHYLFDEAPYEAADLVDSVPTGFLHFGYVVLDVDAVHDRLTDDGVSFFMEPTTFGALRIAFLTAPSGVRIELIEQR